MAKQGQWATIRDIAKASNVSIATVSRYLNQSGYVEIETGQRIAKAIENIGYMPSIAARSLRSQKSKIILLAVPDICNPFYSRLAKVAQKMLSERGHVMTLYDSNESTDEVNAVAIAQQIYASGIILASIDIKSNVIEALRKSAIPVVGLNAYAQVPFDTVHVKSHDGTYLAMRHLLQLGHRRIGFAGGTPGSMIANSRRQGYEAAMSEMELPIPPDLMMERGFSQEDGYEMGKAFARMTLLPTGICCANDQIALGLINAVQEAGYEVPNMLSVTGMDDIPYARTSNPSLTTVTNDSAEFAREGIQMLFDRIESRYAGVPRDISITHALVPRASTRKPRAL